MNNKASYIALGAMIAILLTVDIFLLARTVSYRKEIAIKDETIWRLSDSQILTTYLESNFAYGLKYNRSRFAFSSIADLDGNEVSAGKFDGWPLLVFRFNELDCKECISFGLNKLSTFAAADNHVVVMARYNDIHPFQRWGRAIEFPYVDVYFAPSAIEADEISAPYFFMLYEDMTIGELFIPDKSFPKQTNTYLEMISEKYYKP